MAQPDFDNAPQPLTFANRAFTAQLLSFSGSMKREYAAHRSLKRSGSKIEDMARASRRLEARLIFITIATKNGLFTAADQYQDFVSFIDRNPFGLLIHPVHGQWRAFCEGPQEDIDLSKSKDSIDVRVSWIEDELDATVASDTPDVATAAQDASDQQTTTAQDSASFMGQLARGSAAGSDALNSLDDALAQVSTFSDPVNDLRDAMGTISGVGSKILSTIDDLIVSYELLNQDVTAYISASSDLFTGTGDSTIAGTATSLASLIAKIQDNSQNLIDAYMAASTTPAGAADAVGAVEEMVANCLILDDAIRASKPPTIQFVVPELMDLITVARITIPERMRQKIDILARASTILGLNHIPNPAAIPGGTVLLVPAR